MYFLIAARNLIQARRRSLLLGLLFALVTTLLVLLLSASNGITDNMIKSAITLTTGHVNVGGFYKASAGDSAPLVTNAPEVRKIVEANTPGLSYIIERGRGWARVVTETGSIFSGVTGIDPKQETHLARTLTLAPEKSYHDGGTDERKGDLSKLGQPGTIVMFAGQAKKLGIRVGDLVTLIALSLRGSSNSADVTVIAVCEDLGLMSMFSTFTAKQTGLDLYQLRPDTTGAIQIYLDDIDHSDAVMEHLREVFEKKGYKIMDHDANPFFMKFEGVVGADWLGQELDFTTWHDEVSFLAKIVWGFNIVSIILVIILVLVIAVGIMNTMWMSVRERTGEIGTLRAIGMQRSRVLGMFLLEATLLGAAATTAGALLGCVLAFGIDAVGFHIQSDAMRIILLSDKLHMVVTPWEVAASILGFTAVAAIAALWPAIRASGMQPVTAIQNVD